MTLYAGSFKTTDGKKWGVAFHAHSLDDARAVAEPWQVSVDGIIVRTVRSKDLEEVPSVSHFAGWRFLNNRFQNLEVQA